MANSGNNCCTFDDFFYNQIQFKWYQTMLSFLTIPGKVRFLTCFISSLFIEILMSTLGFLFFYLKSINLVFPAFKDSLLAFNQSEILFIWIWMISFNFLRHVWLKRMFVLSAINTIETSSLQNWISFMYKRNYRGPRTNPCGIPLLIVLSSDCTPLYFSIRFLLHR